MVNVPIPDYVIQGLRAKGVINEKALRNCDIRQRFQDLRNLGNRADEARQLLANEYGLKESAIRKILYRKAPKKHTMQSFSSII